MKLNIVVNIKHRILREIKDLSTASGTLPPFLDAPGDEKANLNHIAEMMASDPALGLKLHMRRAAPLSAPSTTFGSFSSALLQLGFETVYRIIPSANGAYVIREISAKELA